MGAWADARGRQQARRRPPATPAQAKGAVPARRRGGVQEGVQGVGVLSDCIFCKIVAGDIPADVVYEDERVIAFRDINPQAPTHVQIIPRTHVPRIDEFDAERDTPWLVDLFEAANEIAEREG